MGLFSFGSWDYFNPLLKYFDRCGRLTHFMTPGMLPEIGEHLERCDTLILWNGTKKEHKPMLAEARELGLKIIYSEMGFAPQAEHVLYDLKGINAGSSLMDDDLSWITDEMRSKYRKFRRGYAPVKGGDDYVFVPLQMEDDSNIRDHSKFGSMQEFVFHCCRKFAGEKIVFKRHPNDVANYRTRGHELVTDGHIFQYAKDASRVYGINSTALLECSMIEGLEVTAIGGGFLQKPEPREEILTALYALQISKHETGLPDYLIQRLGV